MITLLKKEIIPLPDISRQDLQERSKHDQFARFVTFMQVLYFVVHSIGRLGSHLPLSPLEVSTIAFVCCAISIEYFSWGKLLDIRAATILNLPAEKHERFIAILPKLRFHPTEQDLAEEIDAKRFYRHMFEQSEVKPQYHLCNMDRMHLQRSAHIRLELLICDGARATLLADKQCWCMHFDCPSVACYLRSTNDPGLDVG